MNNKFLYGNINDSVKAKLENQKRQSLINEINYRYKLKKDMYKQVISQNGGAKISLDGLNGLLTQFKAIDKTQITSKLSLLNDSIDKLNKLTENVKVDLNSLTAANADMIINDSSTFITSLNTSGQIIKKEVGIKYSEQFRDLEEYRTSNLDNLQTIKSTLKNYKTNYDELLKLDHSTITREKITEINKIKEDLDKIFAQVSAQNAKIATLKEYSALKELGFDNSIGSSVPVYAPEPSPDFILIESSKPSIIFARYLSKIQTDIGSEKQTEYIKEFLDLYKITLDIVNFDKLNPDTKSIYSKIGTSDVYELNDSIKSKTSAEQTRLLSYVDNKCSITKIKEF